MARGNNRDDCAAVEPNPGFSEAPAVFRGVSVAAADATRVDPRFVETTALVRAFSAIEDDAERARVLALARALARLPAE